MVLKIKAYDLRVTVFCYLFYLFVWPFSSIKGQTFAGNLFNRTNHIEIPFEFVNGFIVLDVRYGASRLPLKFIFDTGAEYSVLSHEEYALLSGVRFGRTVTILGADLSTRIQATVTHDNQLNLADRILAKNVDMILLAEDYMDLGRYVGFPIHGIIGANVFSRFIVEINYKKGVIIFHNPQSKSIRRKGYVGVPADFLARKPYIQMRVEMPNGQAFTGKYLIDCGADLSLLMVLGSHEQLVIPQNTIVSGIAAGLGGNMNGYMGRVNNIELASLKLPSPVIHYQERPDSSRVDLSDKNGIVGNRILSLYSILIDYPRRKIYLKPYHKRVRPIPIDKSGLSVIASGPFLDRISIGQVLQNSPAALAGLQSGDVILKFNGLSTRFWGIGGIARRLARKEGKKIRLTILRDGRKMKFSFRLKSYI